MDEITPEQNGGASQTDKHLSDWNDSAKMFETTRDSF